VRFRRESIVVSLKISFSNIGEGENSANYTREAFGFESGRE